MGGGGSGGSRNVGDISALSEAARAALSRERRNVFISFAYEDIDEVNLLRGQSKNELSDVAFNDWSVSEPYESKNADYIKNRISERISQSSVTVVYLSSSTANSKWVGWEVERSRELNKAVVAVHAGANPPASMPVWVRDYGIKVTSWANLPETLRRM